MMGLFRFLLAEHVSEAELAHSVPIRNVAFRATHFGLSLEKVIFYRLLLLRLFEVRQCAFSQDEVSLVRVVLNRSAQDHVALLEVHDGGTLDEA